MYPPPDSPRRRPAANRPPGPAKGFTLVEILLAITVFGLVTGIIFGSYTKTLDNVEQTDISIRGYAQAKTCLERISADLKAIRVTGLEDYRPPETTFSENDPWRVEGEEREGGGDFPRLSFASLAHVDLSGDRRAGTALITYYVTREAEGGEDWVLRRRDAFLAELFGEGSGADPILCDKVKALKFIYFNAEGDESASWDSDSDTSSYTTPRSVGVVLDLVGKNGPDGAPVRFETTIALPSWRDRPPEAS